MFNPSDYDLNPEYRQRQMARSSQVQQVDSIQTPESTFTKPTLQVNPTSMLWITVSLLSLIIFFIFSAQPNYGQEDTLFSAITRVGGEYIPSSQDGFVRFIPIDGAVQIIALEDNNPFVDVQCVEILPTSSRAYHRVLLSDGRMQLVNADELLNLCGELELTNASTTIATDTTLSCHLISEYLPTIDPDYYRVILTDETIKVIHKSMLPSCTLLV